MGGLGMPCFFIGLKYIPVTKATLIFNVSPILISVGSYFILNEQITKLKIFAVVGSFIGVGLFTINKNYSIEDEDHYFLGIALVAFTSICASGEMIIIRILNQHIHYALNPFWFGITAIFEALILILAVPSVYNFTYYTWTDSSLFLMSGVFNYAGQIMKSLAFKHEEASVVTPFQYLEVLYLAICDIVLFHYSFSFTDILGSIIITF